MTQPNGMLKDKSEELQQDIIKAVQKAMVTFQKSHAYEIDEFTCFGMKQSEATDRWRAYVCFNIIMDYTRTNDSLNRQILEQWIRDAVNSSVKGFMSKTGAAVNEFSVISSIRRTRMGQNVKMLGFQWHTQYP